MRSSMFRNVLCAMLATGTFAMILGCGGGTSSTSPSISPPPHGSTSTPPPVLQLSPSSITFPAGRGGSLSVVASVSDPSFANVAIVKDSCTGNGIATAQASPQPEPTPTPGTVPYVFVITSGARDGACSFTFEDMASLAHAVLPVSNQSSGRQPSPSPSPSGSGSPPPTPTPVQLQVSPTSMAFTGPGQQQVASMSFGDNYQSYSETDNCGGIATANYFDYGDWQIVSGSKGGNCAFNFTVTGYPSLGIAVMTVTNTGGARPLR